MSYLGKHKMGPAHHTPPAHSSASPLSLAVCLGTSQGEICLLPVARVILRGRHEKIRVVDTPPSMGALTWVFTDTGPRMTGLLPLVQDLLEATECSRLLVIGWLDNPFVWGLIKAIVRVSFLDLRAWCAVYVEGIPDHHQRESALDDIVELGGVVENINVRFIPRSIQMHIPKSSSRVGRSRAVFTALLRQPQSGYLVTQAPLCTQPMGSMLAHHDRRPPPQASPPEEPSEHPSARFLKEMDWTDVHHSVPSCAAWGFYLSSCSSQSLAEGRSSLDIFTRQVDPGTPEPIKRYLASQSPSTILGYDFFYATPSMSLVKVKRGWRGASKDGFPLFDLWIVDSEGTTHEVKAGKEEALRKILYDTWNREVNRIDTLVQRIA